MYEMEQVVCRVGDLHNMDDSQDQNVRALL